MKKILYAGSEIMPFAATGGLGDVLGSLPAALKRKNPDDDVRAVMPLYGQVGEAWRSKMDFVMQMTVPLAWRRQYCGVFSLVKDGVTVYFLDNEYYFKRPSLYGEYDDAERFAFFSVAVLELMRAVDFFPDILHANDWQTALSYIVDIMNEIGYDFAAFGNHEFDYKLPQLAKLTKQAKYEYLACNFKYLGTGTTDITYKPYEIVDYGGAVNLTKGAIVCADYVTTVSPNYAKQIQTEEYSSGLHYILRQYGYKIDGIVNGIDTAYYDPASDPELPYHYSARGLLGKMKNKDELQTRFGLALRPDTPIIAMISRLASHKGFDLVLAVFDEMMRDDVQFILLGTGERGFEEFFRAAAARYPGRVSVNLTYDRAMSKLIYAGADIFLMPSRSEACGLSQMIASRYGTVPVVRETGGLYDTIKPYGPDRSGNGFTFASYNAHDMLHVIREAEGLYRDTENWKALVKKIMKIDFSWNASAQTYDRLYERLI